MADMSQIGQIAMDLMDDVVERVPEGAELGEVLIIAETKAEDSESRFNTLHLRCTDSRAWVQLGLIEAAAIIQRQRLEPDEDD